MRTSLLYALASLLLAAGTATLLPPVHSANAAVTTAGSADRLANAGGPATARVDVAVRYAWLIQRIASEHLDGSETPDHAWTIARSSLRGQIQGPAAIAALERGDLQSAVRLLPQLRRADGSAVTL